MAFGIGEIILSDRPHPRGQFDFRAGKQPPGKVVAVAVIGKGLIGDGVQFLFQHFQVGGTGNFSAVRRAKNEIAKPQVIEKEGAHIGQQRRRILIDKHRGDRLLLWPH